MSSIRKDLINIDDMRLDPVTRELVVFDRHIFLRNKEFCLMEYFMKNVGKVLSRTQILEDVWDHNICCATNTVDVHVSSLRQKLSNINYEKLIRTIHCIGYVFTP